MIIINPRLVFMLSLIFSKAAFKSPVSTSPSYRNTLPALFLKIGRQLWQNNVGKRTMGQVQVFIPWLVPGPGNITVPAIPAPFS